jgi:N-acetyl-beta-hexosaminidase
MSTRRGKLASTPVLFAVAMVAISACGGSSSPPPPAAMPTFSPASGAVNSGQTVTISTTTANASIFYTTDGSQPQTSVTGATKKYATPISITAATTIKAIATAPGFNKSNVATASYTISAVAMAATPSFNPPAGAVVSGTTVAISTTTPNATIYYTTDGSAPGPSSSLYSAPIPITAAVTIRAIATASGFANSAVASAAYTLTAAPPAATPTFSPAAGAVGAGTTITISTTTAGATIRYTTDGTDPTTSSTMYTVPIAITAAVTIKAIATAPGFATSAVASAAYTVTATPTAATPTFSPAAGAVASGTTVAISTTTQGATIYYTTDGTDPGTSSTQYTAPIAITAAVTFKAIAVASGFANSAIGTAAYTLTVIPTAATPTFSPAAGAVASGSTVTISTTTTGASIYYTTDGTDPGTSSTPYTAPIAITAAVTIKAIAVASGFMNSAIGTAAYTLTVIPTAATPTFSPAAGAVIPGTTVTISTTTPGATIRYTTDGTAPGSSSTQYTAPIAITAAVTIRAIATASGFADSAVGSAAYTLLVPAAAPTFSPAAGAVLSGTTVTLSTTTAGATIRYTTDGTEPGSTSTVYTTPIAITAAVTIKAVATAPGFTGSGVASAAYTILVPAATPTFSPGAGAVLSGTTVTISTTTAGATIRYTTDGTDPGSSSTAYTTPIPITAATTIRAIATAPGFASSAVGSATYTILAPAATPTFNPLAGAVAAGTAVTISSTTAGAMIFYTTDGTQPGTAAGGSTQLYAAPVTINTATTINAIAIAPNFADSAVGTAAYTILVLTPAATPTFSPAAGVVSSGTTVTISSATAGAAIYYTTDGTQPGTSAGGSTSLYTTPIAITAATTINAIAVASGFENSAVGSAVYTLTPAVTPVFTPAAGAVAAGSTVSIGSTTPGAAIYYTTDGTQPGTSAGGSTSLYTGPIAITVATTINAIATAAGFADSAVATAAYTLLPAAATPTFSPVAGGVALGTTVTISSATAGAVIYYTTDGTTPSRSSAVYSTPIAITAATTINAFSTASGFSDSPVETASYTLAPVVVQNFNTLTGGPGTINFNAVGGIVNPTDLAAAGVGHAKALAVVNTNFNTVPTVQVTLAAALSTYTRLQFDYYAANSDAAFKPVYLFASNTAFASSSSFSSTVGNSNLIAAVTGIPIAAKGAWATVTVDLTATPPTGTTNSQSLIAAIAAGTAYFGLGESGPNGSAYFIDNIRVVDASDVSTTLQDFEGAAPTLGVINFNAKSGIVDTTAFASMAANSINPNNTNELMVLSTNYNSVPTFGSVTLPNATVLSNYRSVRITYYALNAAAAFKPAFLYAGSTAFPSNTPWSTTLGSGGLIAQITDGNPIANAGTYATVTFDLTNPAVSHQAAIAALTGSTVYFGFGQSGGVSGGITPLYFIDDVTLIP